MKLESASAAVLESEVDSPLTRLEAESVDYFVSFAQIFGLPKSVGQIYGLLFVSDEALCMDEVIERLGISKGSASQGLALLRSLGAVSSHNVPEDRRERFETDLNVSRIATHFFENRLRPRLDNGEARLESMLRLAREEERRGGSGELLNRLRALQKWQSRGTRLLPFILRWLRR